MKCLLCRIVNGESPWYKIYEDEKHLAFLDIYPQTKGQSLVITKKHYLSDPFILPNRVLSNLMIASKKSCKDYRKKIKAKKNFPCYRRNGNRSHSCQALSKIQN